MFSSLLCLCALVHPEGARHVSEEAMRIVTMAKGRYLASHMKQGMTREQVIGLLGVPEYGGRDTGFSCVWVVNKVSWIYPAYGVKVNWVMPEMVWAVPSSRADVYSYTPMAARVTSVEFFEGFYYAWPFLH